MPNDTPTQGARQGYAEPWRERLPLPAADALSAQQREAAEALITGPRKGVYGPFLPLLRSPVLLDRVARLGEYLRFDSVLDVRIREFATCVAARHLTNQFEWQMHAPLAVKAGVAPAAIDALAAGARPKGLASDEEIAFDFAAELLRTHGVSEPAYIAAAQAFGEQGVVELATLLGYFVMVSWVMNVAHTSGPAPAQATALRPFPP